MSRAGLVAVAMLALAGCGSSAPSESADTSAAAAAIVDSPAGVVEAQVDRVVDGLAARLSVGVVLDDDEVTADELREILTLAYPATGDATSIDVVAQGAGGGWVDLEPAAVELGFPPADEGEEPPHDFHYGAEATGTLLGLSQD